MKKKIIFVNFCDGYLNRFPLGTAYLIAAVKKRTNYKPILFDETYYLLKKRKKKKECLQIFEYFIKRHKPSYVAFTLFINEIEYFIKYSKIVKKHNPLCKIIVGGAHPTCYMDFFISNLKQIDILVLGEGELILSQILNNINLKKIPNIMYRKKNRIIKTKRIQNYNYDIDEIPWPSRTEFEMDLYTRSTAFYFRMLPTITLVSSRGCPGNCSFCISRQLYNKFRVRNPYDVIKEIKHTIKKYPYIKNIYFTDNCYHLKHPKVIKFLELFSKSGLNKKLSFGIQTKLDLIDDKSAKMLKQNNCSYIGIGLESFSPKIQKEINKTFSLHEFKEKKEILKKEKLFVNYHFISDYPGTEFNDLDFTINKVDEYGLECTSFADFCLIPSTPIYEKLLEKGSINDIRKERFDSNAYPKQALYPESFCSLSSEQKKNIKKKIVKKRKKVFWYWFFTLNFMNKLRYIGIRTKFNPIKILKSILKNI